MTAQYTSSGLKLTYKFPKALESVETVGDYLLVPNKNKIFDEITSDLFLLDFKMLKEVIKLNTYDIVGVLLKEIGTVSYTHLDVYKRQR